MKTTEVFTPVDTKVGLTTDGKILKFATLEDYEKAVDHEQEDLQTNMLAAIKSVKFKNYATLEQVNQPTTDKSKGQEMDEFLAQLLNVDGAVQIQDHIYKVDLAKEKVFVIKAEDRKTSYQDLINGNTSNKSVLEYSTDDDVLYAVRDGINEKCGGIGNYYREAFIDGGLAPNEYFKFSMFNTKAGIYFTFRFNYDRLGVVIVNNVQFKKQIFAPNLKLEKRPCNNGDIIIRDAGIFNMTNTFSTEGHASWVGYSGTRNLNSICGSMRGVIVYPSGQTLYSSTMSINVNC